MRSFRHLVAVAVAAAALISCTNDAHADPPPGAWRPADDRTTASTFRLTRIASVGGTATGLVSTTDGRSLFVARRSGQIYRIRVRSTGEWRVPHLDPEPVADLSALTTTEGERGLLDLVLAASGDALLVSYTALDGAVTVGSIPIHDDDLGTMDATPVISVRHPYAGHNGGGLALTPDGDLVLSLGDSDQRSADPPIAQDPASLLGRLVSVPRAVVDTPALRPYAAGQADVIALGMRNPWRIATDPRTGGIWVGDVGEDRAEEITHFTPATAPANLGWPYREGDHELDPAPPGIDFVDPVLVREHRADVCAVVGGEVVTTSVVPSLRGALIYGDLCSNEVRAVHPDGRDIAVASGHEQLVGFGEDHAGTIYALGFDGGVYRLDPGSWVVDDIDDAAPAGAPTTTTAPNPALCAAVAVMNGTQDLSALTPDVLETRLTQLIDAVGSAREQADPDLVGALQVVGDAFRVVQDDLVVTGWHVDASPAKETLAELAAATGPFTTFPAAISAVMDAGQAC